mgnify:CR=1 FL=1
MIGGLVGLMGLIGLIGLMGLIGLIGLMALGSDELEEFFASLGLIECAAEVAGRGMPHL